MLYIELFRENPEFLKARLSTRDKKEDWGARIGEVVACDRMLRDAETSAQQLKAKRNQLNKQIAVMKQRGEDTALHESEAVEINRDIEKFDLQITNAEKRRDELRMEIPNLPYANVPEGDDATENRERPPFAGSVPQKPRLAGKILDHISIGRKLQLFDLERAAKISGSGFFCLTGAGARLERALINFMLDLHTRDHGYYELSPPVLVLDKAMEGTSQLPKFVDDMYKIEGERLFLAPTAEVPVTNFLRGEILNIKDLPKKFVAYTPCFRREAGSAGHETRGIIRVHQFDKVELVLITRPETSYAELEQLTLNAETVLQKLELHYRLMELCTGDLTFGSAKTYDIEVWSPGQQAYLEVSSCSNFESYQSRRMNLRFKDTDGKNKMCHTLNGSGLALPRLFAALIENFQQPDGSVRIPEKLQPYFGAAEIR